MKKAVICFFCLTGTVFQLYSQENVNVILIVVDDLGYIDLSCIEGGAKDVSTPNIDRLAQSGTRFTNAYAMAPICNASRISIATGTYHQRQGQYWYSGPGLHKKEFKTIAELLKEQGYTTGYVGKFHHGSSDTPGKRGFPLNHGFDSFFGFAGGTKHYLNHKKEFSSGKDMLHQGPMYVQNEKVDMEGFSTELFGEQARKFVTEKKEKKFFLQLAFNAVHNFTYQLPEYYLKEKGLKGFEGLKKGEDYWKWRQKLGYPANAEGREYYLGQLYFLDREIGLLMNRLEELKLRENTAVIFVSDNGGSLVTYANNGPLKGGKYTLHEGGLRVPMIITFPSGYPKSSVSDSVVTTMDILPTICKLTGSQIPGNIDGRDISSLLSGDKVLDVNALFFDTQSQQAVRRGKWKLLITKSTPNSRLQITPTAKGVFLYDLEKDPGENNDLSNDKPELVNELKKSLAKWSESLK